MIMDIKFPEKMYVNDKKQKDELVNLFEDLEEIFNNPTITTKDGSTPSPFDIKKNINSSNVKNKIDEQENSLQEDLFQPKKRLREGIDYIEEELNSKNSFFKKRRINK